MKDQYTSSKESEKQQQTNGQLPLFNEIEPDAQKAVNEQYATGIIYYYDGNYQSALQIFLNIQQIVRDIEPFYWAALCKYRLGDTKGPKNDFKKILATYSDDYLAQKGPSEISAKNEIIVSENLDKLKLMDELIEERLHILRNNSKDRQFEEKKMRFHHYLLLNHEIRLDNNINAGQDKSEILSPKGARYSFDEKEQALSDWGTTTYLYYWLRYTPQEYKSYLWDTFATIYHSHYFTYNEYDSFTLRLKTGPRWKRKNSLFGFPAGYLVHLSDYNSDYGELFINPYYKFIFNSEAAIESSIYFGNRSYAQEMDQGRDRLISHVELKPIFQFNDKKTRLSAALRFLNASADDFGYSYQGTSIILTASQKITEKTKFSLRYRYRIKEYESAFTGWDEKRKDTTDSLHLLVEYKFNTKLALRAVTGWTKNHSNIQIFEYDRLTVGIGLAFEHQWWGR
ncbi:MAG: hypothetical protein GY874_22470 [Desulfobacteraceae bacterium]|nr:hypothetical protein [Desulfobacteraceae bacterium]